MSLFLRLLGEEDKSAALLKAVRSVAAGEADARVFEVDPASFEGRFTAETRRARRRKEMRDRL